MTNEEFIEKLKELNITLTEEQLNQLEKYYELLIEWNKKINLTRIVEKKDVYLKHFYDSITLIKAIDLTKEQELCDIGTGAGFPGIVLKIFFPNIKIILLDSNNKKTTFLNEVIKKLNLKDIQVVNLRAEEYMKNHLNEFDICISRAVAYIDIITSLSLPFIKEDGSVILMNGNYQDEIKILNTYKKELHISNFDIINYKILSDDNNRSLIVIRKNEVTSKIVNYPKLLKQSEMRRKKLHGD